MTYSFYCANETFWGLGARSLGDTDLQCPLEDGVLKGLKNWFELQVIFSKIPFYLLICNYVSLRFYAC